MLNAQYLPHVLYSLALTSLGIHLLNQRKDAETVRARVAAQLSVLGSAAERLRAGEHIPARELDRLLKLARSQREAQEEDRRNAEGLRWGEALLGRRRDEAAVRRTEELDRRDIERGKCLHLRVLSCASPTLLVARKEVEATG
ncbi:hypothetical protein WOLCODRAFT_126200 [Wolfiporia cocos MD-104 SS10]|uniref:Uncharacterized protein n=1 Tax=Wolfiporia cocos (strain MD-104) TaxID=742152 RepID=A0A2H3JI77_WOLCO|nr:hypothetical protein WOLCODRAFT_126200 [Wolfiporia cocos MD-104 SS10]